jgi:protein-S-isoprenylcysteine O-methyltransferase Ste14
MDADFLLLRRAVVSGSGLVYWAGVLLLARRVRKQIGRSPNLRPRGTREKILWAGWLLVVATWIVQPFFAGEAATWAWLRLTTEWLRPAGLWLGLALVVGGYAATLWCYTIMGSAWRIGINQQERNALVTAGPYARVRHPIYAFQVVMLAGALCLLPNAVSVAVLAFHLLCVWVKASDEEAYLLTVHGPAYGEYRARAGRLFPRLRR